jgi:hypothetical protein
MNLFNKETKQPETNFMYTEEQLMARLKFFIGICLTLTLFGIVFVVLYSLIFVTQPLNAISPIDQKFFELIVPIATFLTGTLSGIMLAGGDKDAQKRALELANRTTTVSPAPTAPSTPSLSTSFGGNTSQFTGSFGGNTSQFTATPTASPFTPQVVMSSTGKPMPAQPPQPEL